MTSYKQPRVRVLLICCARMDYFEPALSTASERILCCQCGTAIEPNPANMCVACLRTQVDITEGIPKQAQLYFCKGCERYLQPPVNWVSCTLESRELLSLCLKRLKGLNKVHLVDAGFIWTEPHSKRIKVKLTVQKEVLGSTILQQVFVVEFIVHNQMCDECQRRVAKDFWRAVVQVRQKTSHKKTFFYLEQLILKHNAHRNTLRIRETSDGIDFFYAAKQDARKMVEFLTTVVPCRYKTSQELISHDTHNNTYNYKHTFSVEIIPICKNDVMCLPLKLARSLGNIGQIVICNRVTTTLQVIDPNTLQVAEVSGNVFWRSPFSSLCSHRQLTEFYVLHTEQVRKDPLHSSFSNLSEKNVLADTWVVPVSELGRSEKQYHCRTHLGHLLSDGDTVWGFDFTRTNVNDGNLDRMKPTDIPDVVLIKKSYGDKRKRHKLRNWQLQQLDREMEASDQESYDNDYTEFLEDLEEDKTFRQNVNIYLKPTPQSAAPTVSDPDVAADVPQIGLEEMLQELTLGDASDGGKHAININGAGLPDEDVNMN